MSKAAHITGYLHKSVADKKHILAKDGRRGLVEIVKGAGGALTKFDVMNGQIFIELRDENGFDELKAKLSGLSGVALEEVTPVELTFLKSQAQANS